MFKRLLQVLILLIFASLISPKPALAYLDPGSGSYLIQILIASIAGVGFLIKTQWKNIKSIFLKFKKPVKTDDKQ